MTEKQVIVKSEENSDRVPNVMKWVLIAVLLISGFVFDIAWGQAGYILRLSVWVGLFLLMLLSFSQTREANALISFAKLSSLELQKVVWPTRQETIQTAMIVGVVVFSVGIVLWGIDAILLWLVGMLTGQRG